MTATIAGGQATFVDLPIGLIRPNPDQPRKFFSPEGLTELAASIAANGLLQPLTVRPDPEDPDAYMLIAGERRWRACQIAQVKTVPVRILSGLSHVEAYVLSVTENVNRSDMTVLEEANAYAELVGAGKTAQEVADLFGKRPADVTWRIDLLRLRDEVQDLVDKGGMGPNLAWYLSELSPAGQQVLAARFAQGKFRTDADAIEAARVMKEAEDQAVMFEVQDWEPAPAKPERKPADAGLVDAVRRAAAVLADLAEADPDEVDDVSRVIDEVDQLRLALTKARRLLRRAEARQVVRDSR